MTADSSEIRRSIEEYRSWLDKSLHADQGAFPQEVVQQWQEDLRSAEHLLEEKVELPIAMLGPSQQGKSTLLNALVGETLLAVGGAVGACTCVITSIHHASIENYRAEIDFIDLEAWRSELRHLENCLRSKADTNEGSVELDELQSQIEAASEKLKAVYRIEDAAQFDFRVTSAPDCGLPAEIVPFLKHGKSMLLEENTSVSLRNKVRRYMVGRQQHADSQFWPLISQIRLSGKFPVLGNGVVLVDLPGLDDPNPAREQVTRTFLSEARYLWLVCNSQTGISNVFKTILRDERLLFRLFMEGRLEAFSIVATQADAFNLAVVLEQMGESPDSYDGNITRALSFRRERVIEEIRSQLASIAQGIVERADPSAHSADFIAQVARIPIFVVATASYLNAKGLNPLFAGHKVSEEDSQIPALLKHLGRLTIDQNYESRIDAARRRLQSLYDSINAFNKKKELTSRVRDQQVRDEWLRFRDASSQLIVDRRQNITKLLAVATSEMDARGEEFSQRLESLEERARKNLEDVLRGWEQINWRTLKAAVDRGGVWYSKSLHRQFDLNQDVASAFLNLVPLIWDEFFQVHLVKGVDDLADKSLMEATLLTEAIAGQLLMLSQGTRELSDSLRGSIKTARTSYDLRANEARADLRAQIQRSRHQLSSGVLATVSDFMKPSYETAQVVPEGKGIKERLLAPMRDRARQQAPLLFVTMRKELSEGVATLRSSITPVLERLSGYAHSLIDQIHLNIDTVEATTPQQLASQA